MQNILILLLALLGAASGIAADRGLFQEITKRDTIEGNDTIVFFYEDFNDGEYTRNPIWREDIRQTCAPEAPRLIVANGVLSSYQSGGGTCGTNAAIEVDLNIPVTSSTRIMFDVKPTFSTVDEGAGWFDVEYPVYVILWLIDEDNRLLRLMFGYNYRGGESFYEKDNISMAFPNCRQDEWLRNEVFVLRKFYPSAKTIKRLKIGSSGWDYEGSFDNITIFSDNRDLENIMPDEQTEPGLHPGGQDYGAASKQEKAIAKYKMDLELNERLGDDKAISRYSYIVGEAYLQSGLYDSAVAYLQQSLELSRAARDRDATIMSLRRLAEIYLVWNEYQKALETYNELLFLYREKDDTEGAIFSLNEMAEIYSNTGKTSLAVEYFENALELSRKKGNPGDVAASLESLGNLYSKTGNLRQALDYFNESMKIYEKEGDLNSLALNLLIIANVYVDLREYDLAIDNLNKSINIARKQNLKDLLSRIYLSYSKVYDRMGDNKTALGYYKLYNEAKDLVSGQEREEVISDLHTRYQIELKEKEIELLNKDMEIQVLETNRQKIQKNIYIGLVAFAFVVMIIILLLYNRYKLRKEKQQLDLERQKQETENKLLLSQINPHFIFNSLNSINSFITGKDVRTAQTYLTMFADLMRGTLENTRKSHVSLDEEINALKLLLELERLRFGNKFDYTISIDEDIDVTATYIPPMLVQPFVENAIIHGIKHKKEKGNISLKFSLKDNTIHCTVTDDGVGREKASELLAHSKHMHRSLGLQLTNERLALLGKQSKLPLNVSITDLKDEAGKPSGTKVDLMLPFESD